MPQNQLPEVLGLPGSHRPRDGPCASVKGRGWGALAPCAARGEAATAPDHGPGPPRSAWPVYRAIHIVEQTRPHAHALGSTSRWTLTQAWTFVQGGLRTRHRTLMGLGPDGHSNYIRNFSAKERKGEQQSAKRCLQDHQNPCGKGRHPVSAFAGLDAFRNEDEEAVRDRHRGER